MLEDKNKFRYRDEAICVEGFLGIPISMFLIYLFPCINKDISWDTWFVITVAIVFTMFIVYECIKTAYIEAYNTGVAQGLAWSVKQKLAPEHSNKIDTGSNDYLTKLKKESYYIEFDSLTCTRLHLDLDDIKALKIEKLDNDITYYKVILRGSLYDMKESYIISPVESPLITEDLPFNNKGIGKDGYSIYVEKCMYKEIEKFWEENIEELRKLGEQ